jgi:hypothetical protein
LALTLTGASYSTESTVDKAIASAELITRMSTTRATLYDLFSMQIRAKGHVIVEDRSKADFSFAEDGDVSPYDIANICSNYL